MAQAASQRDQFLSFKLARSGRFTRNELAVLQFIVTYSQTCRDRQSDIAKSLNTSVSTIRRTINSLIEKGIVKRTYTTFKRCVLKVVSLKEQEALMTGAGIIKQIFKLRKKRMKSSDRSSMSDLNRSSVSEPTREKLQEKNFKTGFTNLFKTNAFSSGKMSDQEFVRRKDQALAQFKAQYGL